MLASTKLALSWACAAALAAPALGQSSGTRVYELNTASTEQQGCWPPCTCPLSVPRAMAGTFVLTETPPDPLYRHFTVSNVHWQFDSPQTEIAGSGTYRLGGEVAVQQQMVLDLSFNGGAAQHFDSGLVGPGAAQFPDIEILLSIHGLYCFDTALRVNASPRSCDWDHSGTVTVQDIFAFLADWFAGNADFDGSGTTSIDDVFAFIGGWFASRGP